VIGNAPDCSSFVATGLYIDEKNGDAEKTVRFLVGTVCIPDMRDGTHRADSYSQVTFVTDRGEAIAM